MSSTNPEGSTNPEQKLTPAEVENLGRLEAIAEQGVGTYVQVDDALAEIRDRHLYRHSHPSFEAYVRDRWGVDREAGAALRNKPCEALARACDETLSALAGDEPVGIEIRVAVHKQGHPDALGDRESLDRSEGAEDAGSDLLPTLRWLLTQASGTIGEVAHQLESHAVDIGDGAREQLRDDVLVLDGELAVVKALLLELIDWDSELARLLNDEFDEDPDPEDEQ